MLVMTRDLSHGAKARRALRGYNIRRKGGGRGGLTDLIMGLACEIVQSHLLLLTKPVLVDMMIPPSLGHVWRSG